MVWTKKDKVLFRILQEFGKRDLEAQIQRSTRMFLKYKTPPPSFMLFGYYDPKEQQFVWMNDMNRRMVRFIKEGYQPLFGSDTSWKKLFRSTVSLPPSHQNDIPYLMEILNARYRVVRLEDKGFPVYGLVSLNNVKQTFSFDKFQQAMFLYRMEDDLEKKYGSRITRRKKRRVQ